MTSILLCITAGRGPIECRQGVLHVCDAMQQEAELAGFTVSAENHAAAAGSLLLSVHGQGAEAFARGWEGTIQWRAKSSARQGAKRQNWYIGVKRLALPQTCITLDLRDLRFETLRAGGPGGQHQNRTESAVRVVHVPSGHCAVARNERSQHRNRALAITRLQALLSAVHARDASTKASQDWLKKIAVERGNPVRRYIGDAFQRAAERH